MSSAPPVSPPHPALSPEALAEMYAHARREYPNECCGFLIGPAGGALDEVRRVENQQNELHRRDPERYPRDARTAYNLGASDLFKLSKSLRGDAPAKIIYHSHVDVGAYFSDTDQAAAQMDGEPSYPVEYVVIDVRADAVGGAAQFTWDPAQRKYVEIGRYPAE